MTRIEPRSAIVFTAIGIAHLVVIALLLTALIRSGVLSNPRSMAVFNVADSQEAPVLPAAAKPIAIPTDVAPPALDIAEATYKPAPPSGYDPFGGAALRNSGPPGSGLPQSFAGQSPNALSSPEGVEDLAWRESLKKRLRGLEKTLGTKLAPSVVEVLARPAGGFTDIRVHSKTGSEEADQQVIEAVMARQALVPPGKVTTPAWIALPEISVADTSQPGQGAAPQAATTKLSGSANNPSGSSP